MTTTPRGNGVRPARPADPWAGDAPPPDDGQPRTSRPQRAKPPEPPKYTLTTRKPTGTCAYPLILVEGEEYSGKSHMAFALANDERIGQTWALTVGEDVDWLGAVADFDIVNHDGTWPQIMAAAEALHADCTRRVAAGEPTPLVVVDSGTKVWELLTTWAENRARTNDDNRRRLMLDPNAEINVGHAYWNPANRRHRRLVALLRSMPAVVVVTARGKWVSAFDKQTGRPVPNTKEYSVQAQSELGFATTAWVRLTKGQYPQIVGARMAKGGVRPGEDEALVIDPRHARFAGLREAGWEGFSLAWLLFDVLKFDPGTAAPSRAVEPVADSAPDEPPPAPPARVVVPDADETPGRTVGEETRPATATQ